VGPLPGYHRFRGDALTDWDEHDRAYPDIRHLDKWREETGAIPALNILPHLEAGKVVIESGSRAAGSARTRPVASRGVRRGLSLRPKAPERPVIRARLRGLALLLLLPAAGCSKKPPQKSSVEADQLRPASEWLRQEPVRLLSDYVRLETTDAKGEKPGAEFLKRLLDCAGIETEIVCPLENRCNLLARLPGRSRQGALLLLNHIDVVDAFPSYWKESVPFAAEIKLGYLYGRGAYDMKSLGLAEALAMRNLKERGIVPASDILFLAEADEEAGQRWGSRWLLEHRPEWFAGVAAVLNEGGTNEMILRTVRFWGVETVQAGFGLLEFEALTPEPLKELANRWSKVSSPPVEPLPDVVRGFDMLANHLSHPLTDPLRHLDRVRRDPVALAQLPDRYGSFLETRIKWFVGYPYPPGAKDNFRGYVVVSTPPGHSPDVFMARIEEDAARNRIRIVSRHSTGVTTASPYLTSAGELVPLLSIIRRVTEAFYPGVPFGPVPTFGGTTTSIHFRQKGIAAYGYSPVPANITDSARRHGNDERIFLRDYVDGVELYKELLLEFAFKGDKICHTLKAENDRFRRADSGSMLVSH
jgi:acetylornithine deacetylase/succinyl-diaminopimelate desuccinylase-like protein